MSALITRLVATMKDDRMMTEKILAAAKPVAGSDEVRESRDERIRRTTDVLVDHVNFTDYENTVIMSFKQSMMETSPMKDRLVVSAALISLASLGSAEATAYCRNTSSALNRWVAEIHERNWERLVKHVDHRETTASLPTSVAHDACHARVFGLQREMNSLRDENIAATTRQLNDNRERQLLQLENDRLRQELRRARQPPPTTQWDVAYAEASKTLSMLPPKERDQIDRILMTQIDLAEAEEWKQAHRRQTTIQEVRSIGTETDPPIPTEETAAASLAKLIGKALVRDAITMTEREPVTTSATSPTKPPTPVIPDTTRQPAATQTPAAATDNDDDSSSQEDDSDPDDAVDKLAARLDVWKADKIQPTKKTKQPAPVVSDISTTPATTAITPVTRSSVAPDITVTMPTDSSGERHVPLFRNLPETDQFITHDPRLFHGKHARVEHDNLVRRRVEEIRDRVTANNATETTTPPQSLSSLDDSLTSFDPAAHSSALNDANVVAASQKSGSSTDVEPATTQSQGSTDDDLTSSQNKSATEEDVPLSRPASQPASQPLDLSANKDDDLDELISSLEQEIASSQISDFTADEDEEQEAVVDEEREPGTVVQEENDTPVAPKIPATATTPATAAATALQQQTTATRQEERERATPTPDSALNSSATTMPIPDTAAPYKAAPPTMQDDTTEESDVPRHKKAPAKKKKKAAAVPVVTEPRRMRYIPIEEVPQQPTTTRTTRTTAKETLTTADKDRPPSREGRRSASPARQELTDDAETPAFVPDGPTRIPDKELMGMDVRQLMLRLYGADSWFATLKEKKLVCVRDYGFNGLIGGNNEGVTYDTLSRQIRSNNEYDARIIAQTRLIHDLLVSVRPDEEDLRTVQRWAGLNGYSLPMARDRATKSSTITLLCFRNADRAANAPRVAPSSMFTVDWAGRDGDVTYQRLPRATETGRRDPADQTSRATSADPFMETVIVEQSEDDNRQSDSDGEEGDDSGDESEPTSEESESGDDEPTADTKKTEADATKGHKRRRDGDYEEEVVVEMEESEDGPAPTHHTRQTAKVTLGKTTRVKVTAGTVGKRQPKRQKTPAGPPRPTTRRQPPATQPFVPPRHRIPTTRRPLSTTGQAFWLRDDGTEESATLAPGQGQDARGNIISIADGSVIVERAALPGYFASRRPLRKPATKKQ